MAMNLKPMKRIVIALIPIIVAIVLLNVVAFLIPFEKKEIATHYVNYGFTTFVFIAEGIALVTLIAGEKDAKKRVLGLPVLYSTIGAMGVTVIVSALTFILNAFIPFPLWIIIVLDVLVLSYVVLVFFRGIFYREQAIAIEAKKDETRFMDNLNAKIRAIYETNRIEELRTSLENLWDIARGSDPVSCEYSKELENQLAEQVDELCVLLQDGNVGEAKIMIERISDNLLERRAICRANK